MILLVNFENLAPVLPWQCATDLHPLTEALEDLADLGLGVVQSLVTFVGQVFGEYPLVTLGLVAILLAIVFILPR